MTNIEWLSIITGVVVPIIIATISMIKPMELPIIFSKRMRVRNLLNASEAKGFSDQVDGRFRDHFIIPNFEENYFFAQTGIETNHSTIQKYIDLKEKLGDNITWNSIRHAQPHLNIVDSEIVVSVSRWERIYKNVSLCVASVLIAAGVMFGIYQQIDAEEVNDVLGAFFTIFLPILLGLFIANSVKSLVSAINIEKRLKERADLEVALPSVNYERQSMEAVAN